MKKIILDLCGGTGAWSQPYAEKGYDVRVLTLPLDIRVMLFPGPVHGILAAPPCTMFSRAATRVWPRSEAQMREALSIVDACLRLVVCCKPKWWVLENPIGTLKKYLGEPIYKFDPYEFGDPYTKRTWLWGDFAPPFKFVCANKIEVNRHENIKSKDGLSRVAVRAITPLGFARAFFKANPLAAGSVPSGWFATAPTSRPRGAPWRTASTAGESLIRSRTRSKTKSHS